MISVVIPLYNKEKQIAHTIQSVFNQTFQDFEVVIVDDGSTDESAAEVEKFCDSRIRLIHQKNAGVAAARNRGIEEAKGDLIAFLDADDEWKPEYLATQYHLSQKYPDCNVFACNYEFRNIEGKVTPTIIRKLPFTGEDGILSNYFEVASCSHPPLWTSSIVVKKQAIQAIGGFPVGIRSGEDLLTWARLAVNGQIAYSKKVKAIYDLGEGYVLTNLPPRRQDIGDPVGKELVRLLSVYPGKMALKRYISHWHKMRASVAIRYGEKIETMKEVLRSLFYYPFNMKVIPFFFLAMLPKMVRLFIIRQY
ncbi:glycosyltransferase family A protein [Barnesiella viscericola]|uniref:glycosyltransferase family 2 protein n=1 Tax=Barnesiella viscericola TaxID=397865 RepID=UPI0025A48769|nr:glycosyltransferase family A protein [Barnesiella viscericola]MDM8268300.1 glycosyltransferase family A protein [Barnesiella viscericola]